MSKQYFSVKDNNLSIVSNLTGEVLQEGVATTYTSGNDMFMMVFLNNLNIYEGGLNLSCIKVMFCCWKYSTFSEGYEGNLITNNLTFKDQVRKEGFNMSNATIDNCISMLVKKELLFKQHKGSYMLNPTYFFKGNIRERTRLVYQIKNKEAREQLQPNEEFNFNND